MKKIMIFFDSLSSEYEKFPKKWKIASWILTVVMILDITGVIPGYKEPTPYDIQKEKTASIELKNGAIVTLSGYALLDIDNEFEIGDAVYVELSSDCMPSSVRHFYDAHEDNGKMYAETKWCGSYPANLLEGKVITTN